MGVKFAGIKMTRYQIVLLFVLLSCGPTNAQVVPEEELHGDCTVCHGEAIDGALIKPEPILCQECHNDRKEHPLLIEAKENLLTLPLNNGLITCITCHEPHGTNALQLRLPTFELCTSCHPK